MESDVRETRLWLSSPQATEAYLPVVKRGGAHLALQRCKGDPAQLSVPFEGIAQGLEALVVLSANADAVVRLGRE